VFGPDPLDLWYERTAQKQYTRTLLFSTVYDLMSQVVFRLQPSVYAAHRAHEAQVGTSVVSVYNKLKEIEPHTSAALVRYSTRQLAPLIEQLGGNRDPWLSGYRVKIIDGNCLEASEHRLEVLRGVEAGALPGKSLAVYAPDQGLVGAGGRLVDCRSQFLYPGLSVRHRSSRGELYHSGASGLALRASHVAAPGWVVWRRAKSRSNGYGSWMAKGSPIRSGVCGSS
jgi:hypothetical protein